MNPSGTNPSGTNPSDGNPSDNNPIKFPSDTLLDALSRAALVGVVVVAILTLLVFLKPDISINPFPPPTLPAALVVSVPTLQTGQPEALPTPMPTAMPSPAVANAVQPQVTRAVLPTMFASPQNVQTATATSSSVYRYQVQNEPAAISAQLFNSGRSNCDWMGVAGQVRDLEDHPLTGVLVRLGGSLEKMVVNQTTISGTAQNYGPAGFEFMVADHPVESDDQVWVQLVDQSYIPLSGKVYFDTSGECEKNLVVLNFKQIH